jgi:ubiquinone/menaquinone biosynthesis C-methylase UbiE
MALFDAIATTYDDWYLTPPGKVADRMENSLVFRHLEPVKNKLLLDAGCGTGLYSIRCAKQGAYVTGLDHSEAMLKSAKEKSSSVMPLIQFLKGDLHYLPFQDQIFDIVLSITALEFCVHPLQVLREFGRVLKPNGQLVLGVLNKNSLWINSILKSTSSASIYHNAHLFHSEEIKSLVKNTQLFKSISIESTLHSPPDHYVNYSLINKLCELKRKWYHPLNGAFFLLSTRKKIDLC